VAVYDSKATSSVPRGDPNRFKFTNGILLAWDAL